MAHIYYLQNPETPTKISKLRKLRYGGTYFCPFLRNSIFIPLAHAQHLCYEEAKQDGYSWSEAYACRVKPTKICPCTNNKIAESEFIKHVKNTIRRTIDGRIEVSLPWKEGFPSYLKNNRNQALRKLYFLNVVRITAI